MRAKDRIYEQLVNMLNDNKYIDGVTATELENFLDVKRSVISHYLNILLKEGNLSKTNTRPVKYQLVRKAIPEKNQGTKCDFFSQLIGYDGSLREQVEQCKSGAVYPPHGLPILINGNSGVGKSYMAFLIYKYAVSKGIIEKDAPFVELNCADYANNPELLSSVLFGYVEGAFTGAAKGKKGLMDEADKGYLFLDEIHRLSFENQEKLFVYLDKCKFRRLGENESWHSVNVRFIFATTEDINKTLLETFSRRIPLKITLPDFKKRPLIEKIELIYNFYKYEASALNMDIEVNEYVFNLLAFSVTKGNIGTLRNYIKISCARAYEKQMNNEHLIITHEDIPLDIRNGKFEIMVKGSNKSFLIHKNAKEYMLLEKQIINTAGINIEDFINLNLNKFGKDLKEKIEIFIKKVNKAVSKIYGINFNSIETGEAADQLAQTVLYKLEYEISQLCKKYGVSFTEDTKKDVFSIVIYAMYGHFRDIKKDDIQSLARKVKKLNPKAFLLSEKFVKILEDYYHEEYNVLRLFIPVVISNILNTNEKVHVIIATHGDSTASSIASVANTLCSAYIFEPFDMPITDDSRALIEKVNNYIREIDTSSGLILLVDMGSLVQMYEPIKNNIEGELLIINNVTTHIALDIGFKILRGCTLHEIIEESKNTIQTEVRYYEGITQGDNIIISCISGIGIAQKLKDIFERSIKGKNIEIVAMEYSKLKEVIQSNISSMLKKTKLIITTSNLNIAPIPCINIETLINKNGYEALLNDLKGVLSEGEINYLYDELIKFFSIEGIAGSLNFLNPNIIVNEVKNVINYYEKYYGVSFENHLRINLYMHISIMVERLMTEHIMDEEERTGLTNEQLEFIEVTENAFNSIIKKYNINLSVTEVLLMYEVLACDLYKE